MFDKLAAIEQQYETLMQLLGTAEVQSDSSEYRKHAKTLSEIEPIVQTFPGVQDGGAGHRADRGAGRRAATPTCASWRRRS